MLIERLKSFGGSIENDKIIAYGLTAEEFACQHGYLVLDSMFLDLFSRIRLEIGIPLIITSGFRCYECQEILIEEGKTSTKKSFHNLGRAIDCYPEIPFIPTSKNQLLFLRNKLLQFRKEIRIGLYKSHIHFDNAPANCELPNEWWVINGGYHFITDVFK